MKNNIFLAALLIFSMAAAAWAMDTSIESGVNTKADKEQSQTLKKSLDNKTSTGNRKSKTKSKGQDEQLSNTLKDIEQEQKSSAAEVTVDLQTIFAQKLADLEQSNPDFKACGVISNPVLAADLGLSAEIRPGVIDSIKADYLNKAAASNLPLPPFVDPGKVKHHINCLALYGANVAQAYLYLTQDIKAVKAAKPGNGGEIAIKDMGYDDFVGLAGAALEKAIAGGIENKTINTLYTRALEDGGRCRLDKNPEAILCGSNLLILSARPQLYVKNIHFYGDKYAGFAGTFRVSRSFSLSSALEKAKSSSRYEKWVEDINSFAESLESQGKSREAVMVRKKAWDIIKSSKNTMSPSKLLPGA